MSKYPELTKLKGKMTEKKETYRSLASKIGMATNTLNRKLNGHCLFNISEMISICAVLQIPKEDSLSYFS